MDKKEAGMTRWICWLYYCRGLGMPDEQWKKFEAFIKEHKLFYEPPPGVRIDGKDPWDVLEERLAE